MGHPHGVTYPVLTEWHHSMEEGVVNEHFNLWHIIFFHYQVTAVVSLIELQ